MPRITLDEVNRYRKENGPILTDAELLEQRTTKKESEVKPAKQETKQKKKTKKKAAEVEIVNTPVITRPVNNDVVDVFADTHELTEKFFGDVKYDRDFERLAFEISRLKEELNETIDAVNRGDAPEVVDGIIDLITFALGLLENFGVDGKKAWKTVHEANMAKEKGTKSTRPDSGGVDLIKPKGWKAPDHSDNVGMIGSALDFS